MHTLLLNHSSHLHCTIRLLQMLHQQRNARALLLQRRPSLRAQASVNLAAASCACLCCLHLPILVLQRLCQRFRRPQLLHHPLHTHVTHKRPAPKSRDTRLHFLRQLLVGCSLLFKVAPAVVVRPLSLPLLLLHTRMNLIARAGTHTPTHTHLQLLQRLLQLSSARVGCSHGGSLFSAVAVAGGARVLQATLALVHFLRSV